MCVSVCVCARVYRYLLKSGMRSPYALAVVGVGHDRCVFRHTFIGAHQLVDILSPRHIEWLRGRETHTYIQERQTERNTETQGEIWVGTENNKFVKRKVASTNSFL